MIAKNSVVIFIYSILPSFRSYPILICHYYNRPVLSNYMLYPLCLNSYSHVLLLFFKLNYLFEADIQTYLINIQEIIRIFMRYLSLKLVVLHHNMATYSDYTYSNSFCHDQFFPLSQLDKVLCLP